ncbi:MAG: class I SAM-dependent methyltransferase [Cyanobacteria bacterium P01_E01_bin.6]
MDANRHSWEAIVDAGHKQSQQAPENVDLQTLSSLLQCLESLSTAYICQTLIQLGVFIHPHERHTLDSLMEHCQIQPHYRKLLAQWLRALEEEGLVELEKNIYTNPLPLPTDSMNSLWLEARDYASSIPQVNNFLEYLRQHGENHSRLLKGELDPLALLFVEGSQDTAEKLYEFNPAALYFNKIIREILRAMTASQSTGKCLKILEIGAGVGATTASILPVLMSNKVLYTYTDVSSFFINQAKRKFQNYSFVEYRKFDINLEPEPQNYQLGSFDIVIAANVLHIARDLNKAISYLYSLLVPQGLLLLLELTHYRRSVMTTTGFVKGFSEYSDERLQDNTPLLSVEQWSEKLGTCGFEKFIAFPESGSSTDFLQQHVMIAQLPDFLTLQIAQEETLNALSIGEGENRGKRRKEMATLRQRRKKR